MKGFSFNTNLDSLVIRGNLRRNTADLSQSFERLSSGQRINKASDDAAGIALMDKLGTDSTVYSRGIKNINDGISMVNMAESALKELGAIALRQKELATQASNSTQTRTQRIALNAEANALVDEFNRIVTGTSYNGVALLDNTFGQSRVQAEYGTNGAITFTLAGELDRNKGTGTFQTAVTGATGALPQQMASGDLDGDGDIDIVTANFSGSNTDGSTGNVSVLLNNGNGTLATHVTYKTGNPVGIYDTNGVTLGDVNNDGILDIIAANRNGTGSVGVLLGNGNGTFQTAATYASGTGGTSPATVQLADFNGDNYLDIAATEINGTPGVNIYLNNGNGTFATAISVTTNQTSRVGLALGDFNGDGEVDIATSASGTDNISVMLGTGTGTFSAGVTYGGYASSNSDPRMVRTSDMNGDGYLDLVTANYNNSSYGVSIFLGNGNGTFQSQTSYLTSGGGSDLAITDFNGDGYKDVVMSNNSTIAVSVLLGSGDGTLGSATLYQVGSAPFGVTAADFNGDGVTDLASADANSNRVSIRLSNTTTSTSIAKLDLTTVAEAQASLTTINQTITRVQVEQGAVAGSLSRFESALNRLTQVRDANIEGVSRIRDADIAQETANMIKKQILQKTDTAILAQANKLPGKLMKTLLEE